MSNDKVRLYEVKSDIEKSEKELKEHFVKLFSSGHNFPDLLPENWGKNSITLTIPYDYLDEEALTNAWPIFFGYLKKYKKLRKEEADLSLKMGMVNIQEMVPE